jgi:hypothetical protein
MHQNYAYHGSRYVPKVKVKLLKKTVLVNGNIRT